MKSLLLVTIVVLLASCGNNKLRFQRVRLFNKQKIVTVDDKTNSLEKTHTESETSLSPDLASESETLLEKSADQTVKESINNDEEELITEEFPITKSDSLERNENEEKKAIALKAEKIATTALWLNRIVWLVMLASTLVALFGFDSIPLLVGAIIGVLLAVTSIVLGIVSKAQPYNTKLGARRSSWVIFVGAFISAILTFFVISSL